MELQATQLTASLLRSMDELWNTRAWDRHPGNPPNGWMQARSMEAAGRIDEAWQAEGGEQLQWSGSVHNFEVYRGEAVAAPMEVSALTKHWVQRARDEVEADLRVAGPKAFDALRSAEQNLNAVLAEFG